MPGATAYPTAIDAFTNPDASAGQKLGTASVAHDAQHGSANDAIEAIETVLGTNPHVIDAAVVLDTTPETVREKTDQLYRLVAEVKGLAWDAAQTFDIEGLIGLFDGTTGHTHDGTDGDGAPVLTAGHNHTAAANDGGVLTNPEFDGFLLLDQIATPGAPPAAGKTLVYSKSDDKVYRLTDAGVEVELGGGGGGGGGTSTVHTDAYTGVPAAPVTGDQWWPSDTDYQAFFDGAAWIWYLQGHKIVMPNDADFSWYNQKAGGPAGSVDVTRGGVYLEGGPDGDSQIFRTKPLPVTPYTIEVRLDPTSINANYTSWGLGVRNSANQDWVEIGHYYQNNAIMFNVGRGDDLVVNSNATIRESGFHIYRWFQIRDDGTTRSYWVSEDGYHWSKFYEQGHATDVTPNQAFFWVNPRNGDSFRAGVWLRHWKES